MRTVISGEICRFRKGSGMSTKKTFLRITTVLSIAPMILGILMAIFSDTTNEKIKGLEFAVIAPVVIWGVYGAAYFPFKGFFSN
jgi:hypothetical protein